MHLNLSLSSPCHIYRACSCVRFFIGLCRHMRRAATTRHRFLPLLPRAGAPACYSYTPSLASCSCLWVFIRHLLLSSLDGSTPHNAIHKLLNLWCDCHLSNQGMYQLAICIEASHSLLTLLHTHVSSQELGVPILNIYQVTVSLTLEEHLQKILGTFGLGNLGIFSVKWQGYPPHPAVFRKNPPYSNWSLPTPDTKNKAQPSNPFHPYCL